MIGIIEKVLVDCLLEVGGDELRQDVFFAAGIPPDRIYRMDEHYPDSETSRLIASALQITQVSTQEFFDLFATLFFDMVDQVFPEFLAMCDTSEDLVRRQIKIHAIMAAGCRAPEDRQQVMDKFRMIDHGPHDIELHYKSELRLCELYETLLRFSAKRFGDTVEIADHQCAHSGNSACIFAIRWTSIGGQPTHFHQDAGAGKTKARANG